MFNRHNKGDVLGAILIIAGILALFLAAAGAVITR